jgi:hypothetical protein
VFLLLFRRLCLRVLLIRILLPGIVVGQLLPPLCAHASAGCLASLTCLRAKSSWLLVPDVAVARLRPGISTPRGLHVEQMSITVGA